MADNFCIRRCILSTFQDSDVLLSILAQNDAKFVYAKTVNARIVGSVKEAKDNYFRILNKWFLMSQSQFLELIMRLIGVIRSFARDDHKRELERFEYRGDLLTMQEDSIVHLFNQEFTELLKTEHF